MVGCVLALSAHLAAETEHQPPKAATEAGVPLPEHPRPDFQRQLWKNLNGPWDFDFDREDVGLKEQWYLEHRWPKTIVVPYVHQCPLSGINDTDHYRQVWYHRQFTVPAEFAGKRVRLHVGAADFRATVWVNGKEAGTFEGGQTPFLFDVTPLLKPDAQAANDVVIRIYDNERDPNQPRGKQNSNGKRGRYRYTHLTGIWQTVWLEAVDARHLDRYQAVTAIDPPKAQLTVFAESAPDGAIVRATLSDRTLRQPLAQATAAFAQGQAALALPAPGAKLWSHEEPNLYDLRFELLVGGRVVDAVDSYLGFRTVEAKEGQFRLNGKPVWLCGALDQGYWPQGLLTPPSDAAMVDDIQWVKRLGMNHIRKHQVVGSPRFLYHCDRLGLLVWGEMANADAVLNPRATAIADREWLRAIQRDFNHPSLVTWVYSNEHWMHGGPLQGRIDHYRGAYRRMKQWDPTRPVIDTSGYYHVASDILDIHHAVPERRWENVLHWARGEKFELSDKQKEQTVFLAEMPYDKQPIVVSEWVFGRRNDFDSSQEQPWLRAYLNLLAQFASEPLCAGECYVQLYDVENERNGYLYYDRRSKLSPQTEAALKAAHLQATRRDPQFDWSKFIDKQTERP
jgi:beta-galactosidase/beta-glucuronidase